MYIILVLLLLFLCTCLVSVQSPDGGAGHTLAPMLRSVVIMDHDGVTNDRGLAAQRKVGVGEELLGRVQIQDLAGHVEPAELSGEVPHPAPERRLVSLAVLVNSETGHSISYISAKNCPLVMKCSLKCRH